MTEKTVKTLKKTNKKFKLKHSKPQQPLIESGSDISDSEPSGNAPKIDKKQLKQISTEVTDLLASLKREHGIDDETVAVPLKGKKNKKEVKNVGKEVPVTAKQPKEAKKVQPKNELPKKKSVTFKQEKPKAKLIKKETLENDDDDIPGQDLPKTKKNKNKKRAAEVKLEPVDVLPAKKPNAQKQKPEKTKSTEKKAQKVQVKTETSNSNDTEEATETDETEKTVEKDHHLKNAVPVFVGNLPTNVKRIKLTKMFKKVGKILSIRMRTNKGKSFLRKAQIAKVPHLIAFIYFGTREEAEAAVSLNGEKIGDNVITVDLDSKEKAIKPENTVVVGNLKYAVTADLLREAFACCGAIESIRVAQSNRGCSGVAFIRFENSDSCALALKLNGTTILDREIRVENYKAKKSDQGKKEKTSKPVVGAKAKNLKKGAGKNANKPNAQNGAQNGDKAKTKKKNKEFLGVKSNDAKKNLTKKKKKNKLSNEKRLAFKVAPKTNKTAA